MKKKIIFLLLFLLIPACIIFICKAASGDYWVSVESADGSVHSTKLTSAMISQWNAMSGLQQINATTAADGTYTWTFSNAYGSGVTPVVIALAKDSTANTSTNVQITAISNTAVSFKISRLQNVTAVLGIQVLGFTTNQATPISAFAVAP